MPSLFEGDVEYEFLTNSYEEHSAEKLYIIAYNKKTDLLNTRVKDFYDVFELRSLDYDFEKVSLYFMCMVKLYGEKGENLSAGYLNYDFIRNHAILWSEMMKKYNFADKNLTFEQAIYYTRAVLSEQLQKYKSGKYET